MYPQVVLELESFLKGLGAELTDQFGELRGLAVLLLMDGQLK